MFSSKIYKLGSLSDVENVVMDTIISPVEDENAVGASDRTIIAEKEGYEMGYMAGEKAGMKIGLNKFNRAVERFKSILEELSNLRDSFYADKEEELIQIVTAIAKKVIHAEPSLNRDIIVRLIDVATESVSSRENAILRLNPSDMSYLMEQRQDIVRKIETLRGIGLQGDKSITPGGCIVEGLHGEVDATVDSGLKVIETALGEVLSKDEI